MKINESDINKEIQISQNKMKTLLSEDFEQFNRRVLSNTNLTEHRKNYCLDLITSLKNEYNQIRTEIKEQFKKSHWKIECDRQSVLGSIPSYMYNYTIKDLLNLLKQSSDEKIKIDTNSNNNNPFVKVNGTTNPFLLLKGNESDSKRNISPSHVKSKNTNKNESRIKKSETPKFIQGTPKFNTGFEGVNISDKKFSTTKKKDQIPNKPFMKNKPVPYSSPVPEKINSKKVNNNKMKTPDKKNIIFN